MLVIDMEGIRLSRSFSIYSGPK